MGGDFAQHGGIVSGPADSTDRFVASGNLQLIMSHNQEYICTHTLVTSPMIFQM